MPWLGIFGRKKRDRMRRIRSQPAPRFTNCTFCRGDEFYEGPSGGAAQNLICAKCGARFNVGVIPGGPILLEVLSGPADKP